MADYRKGEPVGRNGERARPQERRSAPPVRKRRKRQSSVLTTILYILFVILTSAVLAVIGWMLGSDLCAFNQGPERTVSVEVTERDNLRTISNKLYDAGLIEYKWFFRLFAGFADAEEKIRMGTFELSTEMDYRALIMGMRSGSGANMNAETVKVTIPEGYTVKQTITLLAKNGVNTEKALMDAASTADFDYSFIDNDSEDISRLEGYLFPDTYEFYVGHNPKSALEKLLNNFNNKVDDALLAEAEAGGYDLQAIVTIASLIEEETDGTDHAKIASVIYNRLNDNGSHGINKMLNIDAALMYAMPEGSTAIDKNLDSPYNLYKYAGLPPTAVSNPGLKSLNAALQPETTDYYYYALGKDGRHRFFTNYNDHINFVNSSQYAG